MDSINRIVVSGGGLDGVRVQSIGHVGHEVVGSVVWRNGGRFCSISVVVGGRGRGLEGVRGGSVGHINRVVVGGIAQDDWRRYRLLDD